MTYEKDMVFLKTAVPDLRDYILSADLYWTLRPPARTPGGVRIPQLTIGNLMLSQARLAALAISDAQQDGLAEVSKQIHAVRDEWRANWEKKAAREFGSRLNLWQQYLRELRGDPGKHSAYYPQEVRARAILRLLRPEAGTNTLSAEEEQLAMMDQILRGVSQEGPFVWDSTLENGFPQEGFWFLYRSFESNKG
jgi:hypothetical protein